MNRSVRNDGSTPVINLDRALSRLGDDNDLLHDLARFFLEDAPQLLTELEQGLAAGDSELVMRSAHSLKGLSANFDAHGAAEAAQEIEFCARRNDLGAAQGQLPELHIKVEKVVEALRSEVLNQ